MNIDHKKNTAFYLALPMVDTTNPESFIAGETVTDTAYYKDGAGAWTTLAITDTFAEIASTGIYEIDLTAAELNHDYVLIKLTSTNAQDSMVMFKMGTKDVNVIEWLGTAVTAATAGRPDVNADAISESTTAADAVEAVFLGTGHTNNIDISVRKMTFDNQDSDHAIDIIGGSSSNAAVQILGKFSAPAVRMDADGTFPTLHIENTTGDAVFYETNGTNHGLNIRSTGLSGLNIDGAVNTPAVDFNGSGSGPAVKLTGGATGAAVELVGGNSNAAIIFTGGATGNQPAIKVNTTNGDAYAMSVGTGDPTIPADALRINNDAVSAANLAKSTRGIIPGAATGTPTTTSMNTDLTGYADDELIGRVIVFTGGTANGQAATITDYANTSGVVSFAAITTAPAASDTFVIV